MAGLMNFEDVEDRDGAHNWILGTIFSHSMVSDRRPTLLECMALFKSRGYKNGGAHFCVIYAS